MKAIMQTTLIFTALFLGIAVTYDDSESYCVLFPQNGRDIFGVAQRTILVFDEDEVSLIPQVHFEGDARDFGILVPVPAEPRLTTVGAAIFAEASFLTQPIVRQSSQGCGCAESDGIVRPLNAPDGPRTMAETSSDGVTIVFEEIVGTFQAVVLQATSAEDLTLWLQENNYRFDPADTDILSDYVEQNWYFVAMKLDTSRVPKHISQWWSATTSPAKISFDYRGEALTYPLKISAISTQERVEVLVYTIGPDPMRFPDAEVEYANAFGADEVDAIAGRYPTLSQFIVPGVFVTKLRKTFTPAEMQQDIPIVKTDDRREFREVLYVQRSGLGTLALLVLVAVLVISRWRLRPQT